MKNRIIIILMVVIITILFEGCLGEPQSIDHVGVNDDFRIDYLFEKDGIKMYRFYDGGHFHYFTTSGETLSTQTSGKTTYEERIKTKNKIGDDEWHQLKGEIEHESKY